MSEADPVRRTKSAARRAAGPVPVDTQRRWHFESLRQDFKLGEFAPAPPPAPSRLLFKAMILVAVVFVGTYAVLVWQTGIVQAQIARSFQPKVQVPREVQVFAPSPTINGKDDTNAPPNLIEPLLNAEAASPPPETDDDDAQNADEGSEAAN